MTLAHEVSLTLAGHGPLQTQICEAIRRLIARGGLQPGSRLPSSRALAAQLEVSRTTTSAAYDQLVSEGYLEARPGSGTFAAPRQEELHPTPSHCAPSQRPAVKLSRYGKRIVAAPEIHPTPELPLRNAPRYDFAPGLPDWALFPADKWRRLVAACVREMAGSFGYVSPSGLAPLREAIAGYIRTARAVSCSADRVIVVSGTQQAVRLICRVLVEEGDGVVVEEPVYSSVTNVFRSEGLKLLPARVDEEGVDIATVSTTNLDGARLAYVTPSHQFPTGAILSYRRRLALLEWARGAGAFIIEDDYDSEFRYEGQPIQSLQGMAEDSVIYTGTFSKTMHPSLRLAYLVAPPELLLPLQKAAAVEGFGAPALEQLAVSRFVESGEYAAHVRRARAQYRRRRDALLEVLREEFCDDVQLGHSAAGLHILVSFSGIPSRRYRAIRESARRKGVQVYSAARCYARPPGHVELIVGYAALSERTIRHGIRRLAAAVAEAA